MAETKYLLLALCSIFVLGIGSQWLAWRLRVPSILPLLACGFLAGPVTGWLDPDALLGELLLPIVSLSVGVILFEGGLSLRVTELREIGSALSNLLTIGVAVTWLLGTIGAHWIAGLEWKTAFLLGAILVVTGPTVIGPMLRQIRPEGRVGAIAKWEGIVIDPIGAVLALLVFEALEGVHAIGPWRVFSEALEHLLRTLLVGIGIGAAAAGVVVVALRRFWIPDYLQSPVLLMAVVAAFTGSNVLQDESGLLTVTLMGILLANQRSVPIQHIMEFKESLQVLLISSLFLLLAARLDLGALIATGWPNLVFVGYLIIVVRPLSVLLSAVGTDLSWPERVFLSWLAPRGIVAAAVASVFGLRLEAAELGGAGLASITFLVIVCTVLVYGLTSGVLARRLGLAQPNPQGVLIAGADNLARAIARSLKQAGFRVVLVDSNRGNIQRARLEGLETLHASILSEHTIDELDLGGIGRLLALTSNKEINALACVRFRNLFGRAGVFQLATGSDGQRFESVPEHLRGRLLFAANATSEFFETALANGAVIKATNLTAKFNYRAFREHYGEAALVMFAVTEQGTLLVQTQDKTLDPKPGQTLLSLVGVESARR